MTSYQRRKIEIIALRRKLEEEKLERLRMGKEFQARVNELQVALLRTKGRVSPPEGLLEADVIRWLERRGNTVHRQPTA
jgi:hypothetical protein